MKIVGCDLHARQQTIAMVDTESGEFAEKTLAHEGNAVREFYAALEGGAVVGIEATGAMQWFLELPPESWTAISDAGARPPLRASYNFGSELYTRINGMRDCSCC